MKNNREEEMIDKLYKIRELQTTNLEEVKFYVTLYVGDESLEDTKCHTSYFTLPELFSLVVMLQAEAKVKSNHTVYQRCKYIYAFKECRLNSYFTKLKYEDKSKNGELRYKVNSAYIEGNMKKVEDFVNNLDEDLTIYISIVNKNKQ